MEILSPAVRGKNMGTVRKIGNDYYIEFEARGLKYQQKAGSDETAAWQLLFEIENKIKQGEMGIIVRDVETDIFFQDFLEYAQTQHTPKTVARYQSAVNHFAQFLKEKKPSVTKLSGVTPAVIEQYKTYLLKLSQNVGSPIKPKVINFTLILLRDLFDYAIKLGYLNDNPTLHIPSVKILAQSTPDILTDEEMETLFSHLDEALRKVIEFILLTGVRIEEVAYLKWSDIDERNYSLKIEFDARGNAHKFYRRTIPISPRALKILGEIKSLKNLDSSFIFTGEEDIQNTIDGMHHQLKRLLKEIELRDTITFATFRHTFAKSLLNRGVSLARLYKYLGLSDIAKVMIYSGFLPEIHKDIYA